jgi:hypothetical protein
VSLERGPLSLVSTIEELLGRKSSGSSLENRDYGRRDPSRLPCGTIYPQKLALASLTNGGRSVGIVRSRTQATEFSLVLTTIGLLTTWISTLLTPFLLKCLDLCYFVTQWLTSGSFENQYNWRSCRIFYVNLNFLNRSTLPDFKRERCKTFIISDRFRFWGWVSLTLIIATVPGILRRFMSESDLPECFSPLTCV